MVDLYQSMKRRTYLAGSFVSIGALFGFGAINNTINSTYDLRVKLYQTEELTAALEEINRDSDWAVQIGEAAITEVFAQDFPRINVEVIYGDLNVPSDITKPKQEKDVFRQAQSWSEWIKQGRQHEATETSNILIGSLDYETAQIVGISNTQVLPSCCSPVNGHGVVWHNLNLVQEEYMLGGLLLHELGHTLGLKHYHGTNFTLGSGHIYPKKVVERKTQDIAKSIMLSNSFAEHIGTNVFGEDVQPSEHNVLRFNDKLDEESLML